MRGPIPCFLAAPLVLGCAVVAQDGERTPTPASVPPASSPRAPEPAAHVALPGLERHARATLGTRPRRLSAGTTGVLLVSLVWNDDRGLAPGGVLDLAYDTEQGPFRLGAWSLRGPRDSDYLSFEVPVLVTADAKAGAHPLHVVLEAAPCERASGRPLGRRSVVLDEALQVGPPIATPDTPGRAPRAATAVPHRADRSAGDAALAASHTGASPAVHAGIDPGPPTSPGAPGASASSSSSPIWLGAGALLLLALLSWRRATVPRAASS